METKENTTMTMPCGISMSSLRAAQPILRDLSLSAQGTRVSDADVWGVAPVAVFSAHGFAAVMEDARPKADASYLIPSPKFANGVARSVSWSPPV